MERSDPRYQAYVEILKEELIPAMAAQSHCTGLCCGPAREVLGALPDERAAAGERQHY